MSIIYPRGSIITKKDDDRKFCIKNTLENEYECIVFPFGVSKDNDNIKIMFNDVDKLYFFGYTNKDYKKELKERMLKKINKEEW